MPRYAGSWHGDARQLLPLADAAAATPCFGVRRGYGAARLLFSFFIIY